MPMAASQIPSAVRLYSDLNLDFIAHPVTGDIIRLTGADAVKRAVRNLILTNYYERKFRHFLGSGATRLLFENMTPLTVTFLKNAITEVITNYEPRVELLNDADNGVKVVADPDNNQFIVTISFIILNSLLPASVTVFLERLR